MQITQKRRLRLQAFAAQFLLGIANLALITFVCFRIGFGPARTSFAYVILIALVSLLGSFPVDGPNNARLIGEGPEIPMRFRFDTLFGSAWTVGL